MLEAIYAAYGSGWEDVAGADPNTVSVEVRTDDAAGQESGFRAGDVLTAKIASQVLGEKSSPQDAMVERGRLEAAVKVGVESTEGPADIVRRADVVVEGTSGFLEVLSALAGA